MTGETHNVRGLYAHIPFCDGKCGYCAFYSVPYDPAYAARYIAALEKEIRRRNLCPETIYIGGGTPTILSARQLEQLCGAIVRNVDLARLAEWTVEANPGSLSMDKLDALVSAGVNRISLGAQSFDDDVLALLGRRHRSRDTVRSVKLVREAGIRNLSLDLIACVPGMGRQAWENTIREAIGLGTEHISVYALTREEGTRLSRAAASGDIAMLSDDEQLEALDVAESLLTAAGFIRYEISNYARPRFECRHNLSCWRGDEYIGVGAAAASHVGLERSTNVADAGRYIEAVEHSESPPCESELLTPEQKKNERVVFGLRLAEGIGAELGAGRRAELDALSRDGLVAFDNRRWVLTPAGRNLADYVGSELIT